MTSRKPPGSDWESWIDQVIRDGRDRGEFDDLPGAGKPLPGLDKPRDEMWWVRKKVQSEGISYLPPALALRKDREDTLTRLDTETSEAQVRRLLVELNSRIRDVNSRCITGPPSTVMPLDVELVVQGWREKRTNAVGDEGSAGVRDPK
jgi:DnaJ-like protein